MDSTGHERHLAHGDTGRFGSSRGCIWRGMKMVLGGVCIRVAIESPVDVVAIHVVKRLHPQFAPLDIESRSIGVADPISETDL